ncbi:hypothetical protein [Actinomadura welshii]|uniref:hypothetical protein n=1 Tax=Actinomadura welshii TaxID=3103817 RepID=UPI0003ACDF37|nr:hypothetical protein [Actinomadura madurae]
MTDGWPEGWTRKEGDRVGRSRDHSVRAEHHQAAYGRDTHGDPYDPYDDPYAGDQLARAGWTGAAPATGPPTGGAAGGAGRGCSPSSWSCS